MNRNTLILSALLLGGTPSLGLAEVAGDAAKAEPIVNSLCVGCHGADGNSVVPTFPKLAGMSAEYLLKQLQDFKNKKRASDIMVPSVASLSASDMANLAVYYSGKKPAPGDVKQPALVAAGKKVYDDGNPAGGVLSCSGCHGADGAGSPLYPRLAGQHVEYTLSELELFATSKRKNDKRQMHEIAERLSPDERKAVAEYIAGLK